MRKAVNKCSAICEKFAAVLVCITLAVCFVSLFLQVFTRFVLSNPLSWTEELGRYSAVVTYALGFSLAVKHGTNACIDLLSRMLKGKLQKGHRIFSDVMVMICCALLVIFGFQQLPFGHRQISAVLHIPLSALYVSIMLSAAICVIHLLADIINQVAEWNVLEESEAAK